METQRNEARLRAERDFHNERFTEETRTSQAKYYWAIQDTKLDYDNAVKEFARGNNVLEYGCAKGDYTAVVAPIADQVTGIDISDVAINSAKSKGLVNADFYTMDAEHLVFENDSFDLVFGSGILHHLDINQALSEIHRVLKPGGKAIFIEPLGQNPLFNIYRKLTPNARTLDEHPLISEDFALMNQIFHARYKSYGLFTLLGVPFRQTRFQSLLFKGLSLLDQVTFKSEFFAKFAWYNLIILTKT